MNKRAISEARVGRGFFAGIFWGLIVAAVGLWGLSQIGPDRALLPKPEGVAETAPSRTDGQQANAGDQTIQPGASDAGDVPPVTTQALPPSDVEPEALPNADTSELSRPVAGDANAPLDGAPKTDEGTAPAPALDALTPGDVVRPEVPLTNADSPPQRQPEPPAPQGGDEVTAPKPGSTDEAADLPGTDTDLPLPGTTAQAPAPASSEEAPVVDFSNPTEVATPQVPDETAGAPSGDAPANAGASTGDTQPGAVVVNRLPVIGSDAGAETPDPAPGPNDSAEVAAPAPNDAAEATPPGDEEADAFPPGTPALVRYARPFDETDQPLIAIVLIAETDGELANSGAALPFPVTYAIDGSSFAAPGLMEAARAQEQEVVALSPLPPDVRPEDVPTSFEVYLKRVEQSVAVMDEIQASFQASREVAEAVAYQADLDGRGIITYPRGLNSGVQVAEREGVPVALVFREFDSAGQDRAAIKRFLDQAAFRAGQESGVIMVGHDRPETIAALLEWRLGTRAKTVTFAPVSAILRTK